MPTRNVVLTNQQHEFVETLVKSGRYQNASEVLREGLRLVERREQEDQARLAALRAAVDLGWADIVTGRYDEIDVADLDEYLQDLGKQAASKLAATE